MATKQELKDSVEELFKNNGSPKIRGAAAKEKLFQIIDECYGNGSIAQLHSQTEVDPSITTADIGKVLMFNTTGNGILPILYLRNPATDGENALMSIKFNQKTPDLRPHEGIAIVEFDRNPNAHEVLESYVAPRGSAQIHYVNNINGKKGKFKFESTLMPVFPKGAKYQYEWTNDGYNFANGDKVKIFVKNDNGIPTIIPFTALISPNYSNDFAIGATLKDSLDNLFYSLQNNGLLIYRQWTFERVSDYVITMENNNYMGMDSATVVMPEEFNNNTDVGCYDNTDTILSNGVVSQIFQGISGNLLPGYISSIYNGNTADGYVMRVQRADGNYDTLVRVEQLLQHPTWGTMLQPQVYKGWNYPTDLVGFNFLLNSAMQNNTGVLENVDDGYSLTPTPEAWCIFQEHSIQTAGTGTPIQFSSNYGGFTMGWCDITTIDEAEVAYTSDDTNRYVKIGATKEDTVANTADAMAAYEATKGNYVYWEQIDDVKLRSRTANAQNQNPSQWYMAPGAFNVEQSIQYYLGYAEGHTGDIALYINNGQFQQAQGYNFIWLDWNNLPATKEDEAVLFMNMINDPDNHTGLIATIDDNDASQVNMETSVPPIGNNGFSAQIYTSSNYLNANTSVNSQGSPAYPERSEGLTIGIIHDVITQGSQKFAVVTSNKFKRVKIQPHNPIQVQAFDGSGLLCGGNNGYAKSMNLNGNVDKMGSWVGLAMEDVADSNTVTEINMIDINPLLLFTND